MPRQSKVATERTLTETSRLFEEFQDGESSVRQLAAKYGIPFTTLRDRFRRMFGDTYRYARGNEGTIVAIIREYLTSLTGRDKEIVQAWWDANKGRIQERAFDDRLQDRARLYTGDKENRDSIYMCRLNTDLAQSPYLADSRYEPRYEEEEDSEDRASLGPS